MGFQEVNSLDAEITIRIGGSDKKTGKKNPTQFEGYYVGAKSVDSPKSKSGKASLHIFSTPKGNVGVWGKTNMDQKLKQVPAGTMTRVTFTHMQPTPNGEMYVYKVETDSENVLDVSGLTATTGDTADGDTGSDEAAEYTDVADASEDDEAALAAARIAQKAKVQALLNRNKSK